MKANELMIGDWVQDRSGSKMKIMNIEYHCTRVLYNGEELILACFEQANLRPIPLTTEILEKNGFRIIFESELHVSYFQDTESFHVEIIVDKVGIFQKLSMWDGFGNKVTIIECRFVHQLQHALRLCGISDEITL